MSWFRRPPALFDMLVAVAPAKEPAILERLMLVALLVVGLVALGIGCLVALRYQSPGRRIVRARKRETAAYRRRMSERHGVSDQPEP